MRLEIRICYGDLGGQTIFPSVSQYGISVGGTRINRDNSGKFLYL